MISRWDGVKRPRIVRSASGELTAVVFIQQDSDQAIVGASTLVLARAGGRRAYCCGAFDRASAAMAPVRARASAVSSAVAKGGSGATGHG